MIEYMGAKKKVVKTQTVIPQLQNQSSDSGLTKYMVIGGVIFLVVVGVVLWRKTR